ncbi:glutamyl-tRNA amidotransferase [Photorhabdus laumondii]|uniref:glutamyl-tRNA amidotransferase n=1 Tax=Photorhabdus laumondii TaxID=2218628 RepID=UPI0025B01003|nr:glutamyl-tRNA amidotransferase [Photorhabdus laumondii]
MNKNTESLISACHELARVASCDDYLILNEIADKLEFLRKERDSYKEMFYDSCKGLAAIACAAGIKEENDTGSPNQVIAEIRKIKANATQDFTQRNMQTDYSMEINK